MPGAFPQLAKTQVEIVSEATAHGVSKRYIMCPTYYSDAPILDRLFGARPADYLSALGNALDPAVSVFWTGPKVVSDTYPDSHLDNVAEAPASSIHLGQLSRKRRAKNVQTPPPSGTSETGFGISKDRGLGTQSNESSPSQPSATLGYCGSMSARCSIQTTPT